MYYFGYYILFSEIWENGNAETGEHNDRQCLICSKEFGSVKECSDHSKICRTSLKCKKCKWVFHKLSTHNGHVSICDGLNKYKCSGCGMCFTEKKL